MRKPYAVLNKDKIYSIYPNTGFHSVLDSPSVQKQGDLYFVSEFEYRPDPFAIFKQDPVETFFYNEKILHMQQSRFNLAQAKKLIVDDRIPAFSEFWLEDGPTIDEDTGEEFFNNSFSMQGGRSILMSFIGDCRYHEAIPELREIALHDDSNPLQRKAIYILRLLHTWKAKMAVNDILELTDDRYHIMNIAIGLGRHSAFSELYVPNLRKKFQEHYYDHVDNYLSIKWFNTVTQSIIIACGHIPTLGALEIIEEGFKHPFAYVERTARTALYRWCETVMQSRNNDPHLLKTALRMMKFYDLNVLYGEAWNTFKKESKSAFINY